MASVVEQLLAAIGELSPEDYVELEREVLTATKPHVWVPNPGPQTRALESEADELFYGGSAGGGKSDLVIGLAVEHHQRSLILRRFNEDARDLAERMSGVLETREGFSFGNPIRYRDEHRLVDFGGCKEEQDKQRYKGRPHDFIAFDEIGDFLESQYRFIIGWNRSADPNQRSRVLVTGNPPTEPDGLWVIDYWGPWLDEKHPNPAEDGELRWYTTGEDGQDLEVDGPGPHRVGGEWVYARSRTFIRARLDDNPDLTQTNAYRATMASLPPALRDAYRDGRFDRSVSSDPWQVIPTDWILAAQERWSDRPIPGVPMCAIGVDVAGGGADRNVLAIRYDGWYAPLIVVKGEETPLGSDMAGRIITVRRDECDVTLDCGGGYGGSTYKTLADNGIKANAYKGAEGTGARAVEGNLRFSNRRTEVFWRFREALDPGQPWGSPIALPPDKELTAELAAPTYSSVRVSNQQGVALETADHVKKRLGRSPDKAMAVVLAWWKGLRGISYRYMAGGGNAEHGITRHSSRPRVQIGTRAALRRRNRM